MVFGCQGKCLPTVFWLEWPPEIQELVQTEENPSGTITNLDSEIIAGLLLLWLVMKAVVPCLCHEHIDLISDNSSTVSWVDCLVSKSLKVTGLLICALFLCLRVNLAPPLVPLHIHQECTITLQTFC